MEQHLYPGEVEAAAQAMEAKRRQLISQPLSRIWTELAVAACVAAAVARCKYMDDELAKLP